MIDERTEGSMARMLSCVTCAAAALAMPAGAAVVFQDFNIITVEQIFRSTVDGVGNPGMEFAFEVPVSPFTVQTGDTVVTRILFDRPLLIQDAQQTDFYAFPNGTTNLELMFFTYWYAGASSNSDAILSYSMMLAAIGSLTSSTSSGSVESVGYGMSAAYSGTTNWTDASFLLRGLEITSNVTDYQLNFGDGQFSRFDGSISAGRIAVQGLPEPSSIALAVVSLAALGLVRRRARSTQAP